MIPLLPSNTPRFRVHYSCMGINHTVQLRSHSSPAVIGGIYAGFVSSMGAALAPQSVTFVDYAPSGSDIFNPVTTGIEGNIYGSSPTVPSMMANAFTFIGRTSGGRRVRIAVFGADDLGSNYRFTPGESALLDTAILFLQSNAADTLGIDGIQPVWKNYVNVKAYDHWVDHVR